MDTLALLPAAISADSIAKAGLVVVLLVVFAESGLLVGFFLPGDSLLFTAGVLVAASDISVPLWVFLVTVPIAAILGDQVGYSIGEAAGPRVFNKPDSRLFRREYVDKAYAYFERYGARTIVLARFVPIVRTFTPVVAGVSKMDRKVFTLFNVIGGVSWGVGVVLLGFFLGKIAFVANHVELIILGIVVLSVLPIVIELLRARRSSGPSRVRKVRGPGR